MRAPRSRFGSRAPRAAVGALALLLMAALTWQRTQVAAPRRSPGFLDSCRDFTAHATKVYQPRDKDISYVEIHYADGRVVKDETIGSPDYSIDGAAGGEIDFAMVKSGTTRTRFDCGQENGPANRAARRDRTPPCFPFWAGGLSCEMSFARNHFRRARPRFRTTAARTQGCSIGFAEPTPSYSGCPWTFSLRGTSSGDPDSDIASWSIDFGDGTSASGSWSTIRRPRSSTPIPLLRRPCVGFGGFASLYQVGLVRQVDGLALQERSEVPVLTPGPHLRGLVLLDGSLSQKLFDVRDGGQVPAPPHREEPPANGAQATPLGGHMSGDLTTNNLSFTQAPEPNDSSSDNEVPKRCASLAGVSARRRAIPPWVPIGGVLAPRRTANRQRCRSVRGRAPQGRLPGGRPVVTAAGRRHTAAA